MSPRLKRPLLALFLLALLVPGTGCGLLDPDPWEERAAELDRNRRLWRAAGSDTYSYVYWKACECIPGFWGDVWIRVAGGAIESVTPMTRVEEPIPEDQWDAAETVEELFDRVEEGVDRRAHSFRVEYDPTTGHPTLVSLDFQEQIADDELVVRIEDLVLQ